MTRVFEFTKSIDAPRLHVEIYASGLGVILASVTTAATSVQIEVSDAITPPQEATLSGVVDAHVNFPLQPSPATSGVFVNSILGGSGVINIINTDSVSVICDQVTPVEANLTISSTFDNSSGVLLDTITDLVADNVVNQLNGLSGLINLDGIDGTIIITSSGNDLTLQVDPNIIQEQISLSGIGRTVVSVTVPFSETTSKTLVDVASVFFDVTTSGFYKMSYSMQASCDQANKLCQFRVVWDKDSPEEQILMNSVTTFNVGADEGFVPFAGFAHSNFNPGIHSGVIDFRFIGPGNSSAIMSFIGMEINRLGDPTGLIS